MKTVLKFNCNKFIMMLEKREAYFGSFKIALQYLLNDKILTFIFLQ